MENSASLYCWFAPPPEGSTSRTSIVLAKIGSHKLPVLCSAIQDTRDTPAGARALFVGTAENGTADILAMSDGTLTKRGLAYCETYGVQKDAESLEKWARITCKRAGLTYALPQENKLPALER